MHTYMYTETMIINSKIVTDPHMCVCIDFMRNIVYYLGTCKKTWICSNETDQGGIDTTTSTTIFTIVIKHFYRHQENDVNSHTKECRRMDYQGYHCPYSWAGSSSNRPINNFSERYLEVEVNLNDCCLW